MLSNDYKQKLLIIATFLLPIGLVYSGYIFLNRTGPQQASAITMMNQMDLSANTTDAGLNKLSKQQLEAAKYLNETGSASLAHSPFFYSLPDDDDDQDEVIPISSPEEPPMEIVPLFSIQVIMVTSTGNIALIDGVPYRKGHTIGNNKWVIIDIDGDALSITIQSKESGRKVTKYVETGR